MTLVGIVQIVILAKYIRKVGVKKIEDNICVGCVYYWDNFDEPYCHVERNSDGQIVKGYCRRTDKK